MSDSTTVPGLVLHLPEPWLAPGNADMPPFYRKLMDGLARQNIACDMVAMDRGSLADRIGADNRFHILNHTSFEHPRALSAGVAYIYPFWNLDPKGIRAFSSIGDLRFPPGRIDEKEARRFFKRLRSRWVDRRESRYPQVDLFSEIPEDCIAVFFQDEAHRTVSETCYMDRWTMLETVLATVKGPVVVKPHPLGIDTGVYDRLFELHARHPNLTVSAANIHDILAAAKQVVTINSAVGIEAYLHRKPVILCGRSDFHHIADNARSVDALASHLVAPQRGRVYAKFIYWYFAMNCINAGQADLARQVVARIRATGHVFA